MSPEFGDVAIMHATGWSWDELMNTPIHIVQKYQMYLAVRNAKINGGSLDFDD